MGIEQLDSHLDELGAALDELEAVQGQKQRALATLDTAEMEHLAQHESDLVDRLGQASQARQRLLASAAGPRRPASLGELIGRLPPDRQGGLREKIERIRSRARRIQQQASANWLSTYRVHQHVGKVLEILSSAGRPALEAHQPRSSARPEHAGVMLDNTC